MSQALPTLNLANDIAFAIFRVAALINLTYLRTELENAAIEFLSCLSEESILKLERLIKLGQNIKQISEINGQVLVRELGHLRQCLNAATLTDNPAKEDIDLSKESFSIQKLGQEPGQKLSQKLGQITRPNNMATNPATNASINPATNAATDSANQSISRVNGQFIAQYFNQNPEFRFKELCSSFPNISGRTLRRIINKYLKQGKLIRVGNPGPASFYRVVSAHKETLAPEADLISPNRQISQPPSDSPDLLKAPETSQSQAPELSTSSNPVSVIAL